MKSNRSLILGFFAIASSFAAASARAESLPQEGHDGGTIVPCTTGAWFAIVPFAENLHGHGPTAKVPLPAYWQSSAAQDPPPADLAADPTLSVIVRDTAGAVVAGVLGVGFGVPGAQPPDHPGPAVLKKELWWQPLAPLSPGEYRVSMFTQQPPTGVKPGCAFESFARTVPFFVVSEPPLLPQLELHSYLLKRPGDSTAYAKTEECEQQAEVTYCENQPGVCCWRGTLVEYFVEYAVSGLGTAVGSDYLIWIEYTHAPPWGYVERLPVLPVLDGQTTTDRLEFFVEEEFGQIPVAPWCVKVELYRLSSGELVTQGQHCTTPSEMIVQEDPGLVCDAGVCAEVGWEPPPEDIIDAESPPEPAADAAIAEPAVDAAVAEPLMDAAVAELLADTAAAEPAKSNAGCSATGAPDRSALLILALLVLAALARPRHRAANIARRGLVRRELLRLGEPSDAWAVACPATTADAERREPEQQPQRLP
ncbi:MAG: MYXO-CTERM sorting domain-containing protein [Myxococcota bacterium]